MSHYRIRTNTGWHPLLRPMQPAEPSKNWWSFPGAGAYDRLFIDTDGEDMRVTGNWYHKRSVDRPAKRCRHGRKDSPVPASPLLGDRAFAAAVEPLEQAGPPPT
jgi:hypothetical protein